MFAAQEISPDIDLALLQERQPGRFPLLLNSATASGPHSRWDILFCSTGDFLELDCAGQLTRKGNPVSGEFLDSLDTWFAQEKSGMKAPDAFPFAGGWCLYLAYEFVGQIEPSVPVRIPDDGLPLALALRCPIAVVVDRALRRAWLISEPEHEPLAQEVKDSIDDLESGEQLAETQGRLDIGLEEDDPKIYIDSVKQAREYIAAGDVFQVNLSREWRGQAGATVSARQLWRELNRENPAPFAGQLRWDGAAVVSSSPERLVSVAGPVIETRPIAGTRPRTDPEQDATRREELVSHPKERAEHIMLLDLERNDLGRVCRPGTVRVDEFMALESYAHVHHIVSNVCGRLRKDATPGKVLRAVFPGGTITGCPKVRCMQIIHELETGPRGAYTGALGYLDHRGRLDMNILIRSMVLHDGRLRLRAGAGIVADSDPERELEETRAKARGLIRALGTDVAR